MKLFIARMHRFVGALIMTPTVAVVAIVDFWLVELKKIKQKGGQ